MAENAGEFYRDPDSGHRERVIGALGGQGGVGNSNQGGANQQGPRSWDCDAIPRPAFEGASIAPRDGNYNCFNNLPNFVDEGGPVYGAGGDGSPGIIQVHVDDPQANFRFPSLQDASGLPAYGAGLDVTPVFAPPPFGWNGFDDAEQLVPFFGKNSTAQSRWIPLGLARVDPDSTEPDRVLFRFGGVDGDGFVLRAGEQVAGESAVLGPFAVGLGVERDEAAVVLAAQALAVADEIYKRNPLLLRRFHVRVFDQSDPQTGFTFVVAGASYTFDADAGIDQFRVTLDAAPAELELAFASLGANARVSLLPRHFGLETAGVSGFFPADTAVRITFDATVRGVDGEPSEVAAFSHPDGPGGGFFTGDLSELSQPGQPAWDFVRFRVDFDLNTDPNASGVDLSTPRPGLSFLRLPFEY